MRQFLPFLIGSAFAATPCLADLGGADITGPSGLTTNGAKYEARCGLNLEKCQVMFKDKQLMVDEGQGISVSQFVSVTTNRTCRQRSFLLPMFKSCYESQYDKDFIITYRADSGENRSALIAFRPGYLLQGVEAYQGFERDLQIWIGDVLRPIGPSIQVQVK